MFTIDPAAAERCDVAVVVPKMDERLGLERSWDLDLRQPHGKLAGKKYWGVRMDDLNLVVAFLDDQGTGHATGIAERLKLQLNPSLLFLVGTAAGREDKTRLGDVIVSSLVVDLTEQRQGKKVSFRSRQHRPRTLLDDAKEFLAKGLDANELASRFEARLQQLPSELRDFCADRGGGGARGARDEVIASGATLYVDGKLSRVWKHDDRYRAVDMESGGFASALEQYSAEWLVVRGVSDFGTSESKKEEFRPLAAAAAADFLAQFLRQGLDEAHPSKLRPKRSSSASRDEVALLYKALRRYWTPDDVADEEAVAEECERALASEHWALAREAERVRAIDSNPTYAPTLRDRLRNGRQLQVALDVPDIDRAISVARIAADCGAGLIEVGDPLIKQNGFAAITEVHEAVPGAAVVAEMATSDWCGTQVEMAAAAGADTVLLLGCRKEQSVIEAANAATRLQIPLMVDIPEELATAQWIACIERAGVEGVAAIGNLDSGSEGVASLSRVHDLRKLTELPIAVSGGLTGEDFPALDQVPWDVLIVGRAIVDSDEPGGATRAIVEHVNRRRK